MKIAIVCPRFLPFRGGVETHVDCLSRELVRRGHSVTVFTQDTSGTRRWYTSDGVEVCAFRIRSGKETYPFAPGLWSGLLRAGSQFEIVHGHSYHGLAALVAAFSHEQPFVFTPHYHGAGHTYFARKLHSVYRPVGRALFARASQVICVSAAERLLVVQDHPTVAAKALVVPNGLTQTSRSPEAWANRKKLVAYVGRLEPYKRLDLVITAMLGLPADVQMVVVGSGSGETRLVAQVKRLGLSDRVTLAGSLNDDAVGKILTSARVVVTASQQEAFGMVILEARQAGARVVASAIPAHCEVAQLDAGNGVYLWALDTAIPGLVRGLRHALDGDDPGVLRTAPRWPDIAAATEEVYRSALGMRTTRPLVVATRQRRT